MKATIISILIAGLLIGGAIFLGNSNSNDLVPGSNITMVDGKQIIEINAKNGYSPRTTLAQAGVPIILKIKTQSTYDCSAALVIPSISYRTNLAPTGETLVEIPAQLAGTKLTGLCAMGMYNFNIKFE